MIDKEKAERIFLDYAGNYDRSNIMIESKVSHTLRVADIAERIARSIPLDDEDTYFAWFLGLLHDIGRFEQVKRYGTFMDGHSIDHAELGGDILFKENLAEEFSLAGFQKKEYDLAEKAIRLHNKLNLPDDLSGRESVFCNLLRDADKADIFRVICETSLEERLGSSMSMMVEKDEASKEVMDCVYSHRCIPRKIVTSPFELTISHGCMAFELVYDESKRIVEEQGYLSQILSEEDADGNPLWTKKEKEQIQILKQEIESVFNI